jgi:hypothetical protein
VTGLGSGWRSPTDCYDEGASVSVESGIEAGVRSRELRCGATGNRRSVAPSRETCEGSGAVTVPLRADAGAWAPGQRRGPKTKQAQWCVPDGMLPLAP